MKAKAQDLVRLARAALKGCPAKDVEVWVTARAQGHLRFAANTVTTSGATERITVSVTAAYGDRAATSSTEDVTPAGLANVARQAADFAKLVPPSPERMPPVKPQVYARTYGWDAATARGNPESRAAKAHAVLETARAADLVAAGYAEDAETMSVFMTSAGAMGVSQATSSELTTTMRTPDGKQSGWAGRSSHRAADVDAGALAARAAEKASKWTNPIELPPGRYTAVLEPAAVAPLFGFFLGALDRRAADEGRSPFSREGGTRIGEEMFAPQLSLLSDPADRAIPGSPFGEDGLATRKIVAVDRGKLASLVTSRFWAKKQKLAPTPHARNWKLVTSSPSASLDELIAGTQRGVLVTRIWYVRMLAPQTLTVTGLTRDATFLIEDGKVTSPIKNFRINQSVLELLRDVEAATAPELVDGLGIPALRVRNLGFSSLSDAV